LLAGIGTVFTAPTERTPSSESASNGFPFVATMIGGGLEGNPSQPRLAEINTVFHGADGASALQ
jgi:hypothetical protein